MALQFGGFFLAFAALLTIIAICLPMHKTSFYVAGFAKATTMTTYATKLDLDNAGGDFCKMLEQVKPGRKFCGEGHVSVDLAEARERLCAPALKNFFPSACDAVSYAYMVGLSFVIIIFLDIVMNGVAVFLTYAYMTDKPKKQYREVSLHLIVGGVSALAFCSFAYYGLVCNNLDYMRSNTPWGFSTSDASHGSDKGYYFMWLAITFKVVALVLYKHGKTRQEREYADYKEQMEFEEDLLKASGNGYGYGTGYGYGSNAYGSTAYNSNASGYGSGYGFGSGYGGYYGQPSATPQQVFSPAPQGPLMTHQYSAPSPYQQNGYNVGNNWARY